MSACQIDHITVTAASLEIGAEFVLQTLGVTAQVGGKHPRMGTHNLLLRLGNSLFLEIISPDPRASPPSRPRWFGLDKLRPDSPPRLAAWVARTDDIRSAVSGAAESIGKIELITRGTLEWRITILADGSLPLDGAAPALIEWHTAIHPTAMLEDHGLSLSGLEIFHAQPARVSRLLQSIDCGGPVCVSAPVTARHLVWSRISIRHRDCVRCRSQVLPAPECRCNESIWIGKDRLLPMCPLWPCLLRVVPGLSATAAAGQQLPFVR